MNKRHFSKRQRIDLWLASGGKCSICGCTLGAIWHADHRIPYSKGGKTDVCNGQSLCPTCNLSKGANMVSVSRNTVEPRSWQIKFDEIYNQALAKGQTDFLLVATPGAGKTIAQLIEAVKLLDKELINWITVCVPSDNLRQQWSTVAHKLFDLDLFSGKDNCPPDYQGEVITYMQLAYNPGVWRQRCGDKRLMLIADEVHHLGDEATWGSSFQYAFTEAKYRLLSSGTPFRSDNQLIPWVKYESTSDGSLVSFKSVSDYIYGYGEALEDGVCRYIVFPSYDGEFEWISKDEAISATFQDELSEKLSSQRLRTAIDADGDWVPEVLKDAHSKLSEIRKLDHHEAGGLVICRDDYHARQIKSILQQISGYEPVLVTSAIPDASQLITKFAKESGSKASPWIVAVKMIAEGVDIKRLRVGVYLTNIATEMFIRQAIGRVIRVIGDYEDETAYFYFPKSPEFIKIISAIKEEREHAFDKAIDPPSPKTGGDGTKKPFENMFMPINSKAEESDHYFNDTALPINIINQVRPYAEQVGIPEAKAAFLMKIFIDNQMGDFPPTNEPSPKANNSDVTKTERVTKKRGLASDLARKIGRAMAEAQGNANNQNAVGDNIKHVHSRWKPHKKLTEKELDEKIEFLKQELIYYRR